MYVYVCIYIVVLTCKFCMQTLYRWFRGEDPYIHWAPPSGLAFETTRGCKPTIMQENRFTFMVHSLLPLQSLLLNVQNLWFGTKGNFLVVHYAKLYLAIFFGAIDFNNTTCLWFSPTLLLQWLSYYFRAAWSWCSITVSEVKQIYIKGDLWSVANIYNVAACNQYLITSCIYSLNNVHIIMYIYTSCKIFSNH